MQPFLGSAGEGPRGAGGRVPRGTRLTVQLIVDQMADSISLDPVSWAEHRLTDAEWEQWDRDG